MREIISFRRIFVEVMLLSLSKRMTVYHFCRTITFAAAVASLIAILHNDTLKAQTITDTLSCGRISNIDLGAVVTGGTLSESLDLFDSSRTDSVFTIISNANSGFSWTIDSAGIAIQPLHIGTATIISFSADSVAQVDSDELIFQSKQNDSCITTFTLTAEVIGPTGNNSVLPLSHTSHTIIAFKTNTPGDTLDLKLQNNLGSSLTLDSVNLQKGTAFTIVSSSLPATIPEDSSFKLKLAFTASKAGFYTDFVRMPNHSILPLSVQGLLLPNDAVQTRPPATSYFSLYPNPSYGQVTIHSENITQTQVTITDVLGRTLTEASFTGDWQWDRAEGNGIARSGTYFIVVTGIGSNGEPVHEVQRLVLQ
jgi:hypothetical protein